MIKASSINKTGLPPESMGILKISVWNDEFVEVENHDGIADMKDECIKFYSKKRIIGVKGKNLSIKELSQNIIQIKGKVLSIEYLT